MMKKYLLLPVLAGGVWLLTTHAGWAFTAYVIASTPDNYWAIDPSTIQDGASGHRIADVYQVGTVYSGAIAKLEFDCAGRRVQTLSDKSYEAEDDGMKFLSDNSPPEPGDVPEGSVLEGIFTFVCGWPQVPGTAFMIDPGVPNLHKLFIYLSNDIMMNRPDSDPE
jgi:hypothetical protein